MRDMPRLRTHFYRVAIAALLVVPVAAISLDTQSAEPGRVSLGALLRVDPGSTPHAYIEVDPGVPIISIAVEGDGVVYGPVEEIGPNYYWAEALDAPAEGCYEVRASIVFGSPPVVDDNVCLSSLTVKHVGTGEVFVEDFADGKNTWTSFEASDGSIGEFHTSCSQCLLVDQFDESGEFQILDLTAGGKMIAKCSGGSSKGKKGKGKKGKKSKGKKGEGKKSKGKKSSPPAPIDVELNLTSTHCNDTCQPPGGEWDF